ncbi:hypothetical protein LNV08_22085 [Paucibacter sp. TC2R-5]|uniref:hypothetical protein n=1 Tax=Paucibacter sp. TC2R-5 TaxID=2893555 RepID=UPI0021E467DB|nr:hypothetical protein [Paucibacter sp. TC2R-5]MCV2361664.1 hypothetical protein [Paucibacter sp. TC2R-5]
MKKLSESRIVTGLATDVAKRLCRQAVAGLQKMHHTLSGDDSGLETTWDEICVQVQCEQSVYWDVYLQSIHDMLAWPVSQLKPYEREALWLKTNEGEDWAWRDDDPSRDEYPVCEEDVVQYLTRDYVLALAAEWTNSKIRAFVDRRNMCD